MSLLMFENSGNRLYAYPSEAPSSQEAQQTGNSIRYYGNTVGYVLSLIGYASKISVENGALKKGYYVNRNSLDKFVFRYLEYKISEEEASSSIEFAHRLHDFFISHQKSLYNPRILKDIDNFLKNNNAPIQTQLNTLVEQLENCKTVLLVSVDRSYDAPNAEGIDDLAYANRFLGFGYVVDGSGHNNEMMATVLRIIFNDFNKTYIEAYKEEYLTGSMKTGEEYRVFLQQQLNDLGNKIHEDPRQVLNDPKQPGTHLDDPSLKPAMSFAQVVRLGKERVLVTAQFADTMLLIKKADGSFDSTIARNKSDGGVGNRGDLPNVKEKTVSIGDVVYGMTDGIGEFLTLEECEKIISANKDPSLLMTEFKEAIITLGTLQGLLLNLEIMNEDKECQNILQSNNNTSQLLAVLKEKNRDASCGFLPQKFDKVAQDLQTTPTTPQEFREAVGTQIQECEKKVSHIMSPQRQDALNGKTLQGANGRELKFHSFHEESRYDDMGLFSLKVT